MTRKRLSYRTSWEPLSAHHSRTQFEWNTLNLAITASVIFDLQTDLLNYAVQESLAHAALIFATLAAAFTFATGYPKTRPSSRKHWTSNEIRVYGMILFSLFLVSIYALFRFAFYAAITNSLLTYAPPGDNVPLNVYWRTLTKSVETGRPYLVPFSSYFNLGVIGIMISISLAYLLTLLTTMLVSGKLSRKAFSGRNSAWIIPFVAIYTTCFIVICWLINIDRAQFSIVPTLTLLILCAIYRALWTRSDGTSASSKWYSGSFSVNWNRWRTFEALLWISASLTLVFEGWNPSPATVVWNCLLVSFTACGLLVCYVLYIITKSERAI